ncbi:hypothetical protein CEN44_14605 [Fischerella muscicola CCMEE 5323]|uniref:Uncharacterized protein n=1 Tax=Fischerella muscicola CCMEE 5323 TaxID=2019572 RepID=A0A2N6K1V2_FISMU|nr:hypothetical protein CEN44_14605 [Fischerella muscicola CCMEE 5323]
MGKCDRFSAEIINQKISEIYLGLCWMQPSLYLIVWVKTPACQICLENGCEGVGVCRRVAA